MKNKKKILIVFVIILVIILISAIIVKKVQDNKKGDELEVIDIFQKQAYIEVFINNDVDDIDNIENQLKKLEHIESIKFRSKEEALQEMKERFSNNANLLDSYKESNIFPNSFILKIEVNSIDDINEDYFSNVIKNIREINGIKKISGHCERTCYIV